MSEASNDNGRVGVSTEPRPVPTPDQVRAARRTGAPARSMPATVTPGPLPATGRPMPTEPDEMRDEIERTRERMSRTIDEIEQTLVRQKESFVGKVTLRKARRRLSEEPWRSIAIAFVAGYVIAAIRD